MSLLTAPTLQQNIVEEFHQTGLVVIPNAFSANLARGALRERLDRRLFRKPIPFNTQLGQIANLRARDAPPGTALEQIIAHVKQLGESLDLDFDPKPHREYLVQALELIAPSLHLYDLGGTSISAVAGLEGDLQLGGGWLDNVARIAPGTIVIVRSHHLLPYRVIAGSEENATGLIIPGNELFGSAP